MTLILILLLAAVEPADAAGNQEMFQPQCELSQRLSSLDESVIDDTKELDNSK